MKKEASVILAKCAQDKLYGIRIEKRDNDWVRTWAFKLKEETAEKEGCFCKKIGKDAYEILGIEDKHIAFSCASAYYGTTTWKLNNIGGNCGKVSCYDGSDKVVCNWCGSNGTAADDDGKLDVSGGGF